MTFLIQLVLLAVLLAGCAADQYRHPWQTDPFLMIAGAPGPAGPAFEMGRLRGAAFPWRPADLADLGRG